MATKPASPADDAPPTASKTVSAEQAAATIGLEPHGDALNEQVVTINRPRQAVFEYFRDFAKLATFMENVERIDVIDDRRSHWVVKAPAGKTVEWDAVVTEEIPGEMIAWASAEGAGVPNSGRITFRDAGARGTVVSARILYDPPAGVLGKIVAKMFQREPAIQARRDLRRFKQVMETGEVTTSARNRAAAEAAAKKD